MVNYGSDPTGMLVGTSEDVASTQGLLQGLGQATDGYFGKEYGRIYKEETSYRRRVDKDAIAKGKVYRRIYDVQEDIWLADAWTDPWDD